MENSFAGRVALVTGASRGIGRAIGLAYAARGGSVALVGRDREALDEVAAEAAKSGGRAEVIAADISRRVEQLRLIQRAGETFGRLDALVHAAGIYAVGPESARDLDRSEELWRVNAEAPLALTLGFLELLRASEGEVVFINSSVVRSPAAGLAAYAASKRALAGIADSLRDSLNPMGIRVLTVYPGRTATPMQRRILEAEGRSYQPEKLLQPDDVASMVVHALTLPRTAEVTDLHLRPFRRLE